MKKEESLSDKRIILKQNLLRIYRKKKFKLNETEIDLLFKIIVQQNEEAVKKLKEEEIKLMKQYDNHKINWITFVDEMFKLKDKIFGDKLVRGSG